MTLKQNDNYNNIIDIIFRNNYNSNQAVYLYSEYPMLVLFYLIKWFSKKINKVIIMIKET